MIHHPSELYDNTLTPEEFALDRGFTGLEEEYECVESGVVKSEWIHMPSSPFTGSDRNYTLYRKGSGGATKFCLIVDYQERPLTHQNLTEFVSFVWFHYYRYDAVVRRRNGV